MAIDADSAISRTALSTRHTQSKSAIQLTPVYLAPAADGNKEIREHAKNEIFSAFTSFQIDAQLQTTFKGDPDVRQQSPPPPTPKSQVCLHKQTGRGIPPTFFQSGHG